MRLIYLRYTRIHDNLVLIEGFLDSQNVKYGLLLDKLNSLSPIFLHRSKIYVIYSNLISNQRLLDQREMHLVHPIYFGFFKPNISHIKPS